MWQLHWTKFSIVIWLYPTMWRYTILSLYYEAKSSSAKFSWFKWLFRHTHWALASYEGTQRKDISVIFILLSGNFKTVCTYAYNFTGNSLVPSWSNYKALVTIWNGKEDHKINFKKIQWINLWKMCFDLNFNLKNKIRTSERMPKM